MIDRLTTEKNYKKLFNLFSDFYKWLEKISKDDFKLSNDDFKNLKLYNKNNFFYIFHKSIKSEQISKIIENFTKFIKG